MSDSEIREIREIREIHEILGWPVKFLVESEIHENRVTQSDEAVVRCGWGSAAMSVAVRYTDKKKKATDRSAVPGPFVHRVPMLPPSSRPTSMRSMPAACPSDASHFAGCCRTAAFTPSWLILAASTRGM